MVFPDHLFWFFVCSTLSLYIPHSAEVDSFHFPWSLQAAISAPFSVNPTSHFNVAIEETPSVDDWTDPWLSGGISSQYTEKNSIDKYIVFNKYNQNFAQHVNSNRKFSSYTIILKCNESINVMC